MFSVPKILYNVEMLNFENFGNSKFSKYTNENTRELDRVSNHGRNSTTVKPRLLVVGFSNGEEK